MTILVCLCFTARSSSVMKSNVMNEASQLVVSLGDGNEVLV